MVYLLVLWFNFKLQAWRIQMNKYDEAIEFLKGVEPGSYFDECAELIEELLAQLEAKKPKRQRYTEEELAWLKQAGAGARYYAKARGLL
jgi:hypothetical protein